ncbi:hypothetical protein MHYP_G00248260 [Metynnis hypsauchen]
MNVSCRVSQENLLHLTFPGPLMRNDLDEMELIRFVQMKSLEGLMSCDDQPDQQTAQLFWTIMELLYTEEQTVKWTDITDLLLRTCKSLRKQDDWLHHLVLLFSSSSDSEDQQVSYQRLHKQANLQTIVTFSICWIPLWDRECFDIF